MPLAYMEMIFWSMSERYLSGVFNHLWLECGLTVLRDLNVHSAIAAIDALGFVTATIIICVRTFWFLIAQMLIHLCFHHFFDGTAKQGPWVHPEYPRPTGCRTHEEAAGWCFFSICHLYLVYWFLFSCHNKRPPTTISLWLITLTASKELSNLFAGCIMMEQLGYRRPPWTSRSYYSLISSFSFAAFVLYAGWTAFGTFVSSTVDRIGNE